MKGEVFVEIVAYYESSVFSSPNYNVICCSTSDVSASLVPQRKFFAKKEKYVFSVIYRGPILKEFDKRKRYVFTGEWKDDKYGKSFFADYFEENVGKSEKEIKAFLLELKGVGKATANKIYSAFGADTVNVFKKDINKLYELKIPKSTVESIISSYRSERGLNEAIDYFKKFSLSLKKINRIYEKYKETAITTMQVNPFEISSSGCISFIEANSVAIDLGVELNSGDRQRQALIYVMQSYFRPKGHLFFSINDVISVTLRFLNKGIPEGKGISEKSLRDNLKSMDNGEVKICGNYVYLMKDLFAEKKTADILVDLMSYKDNSFKLDVKTCFKEISEEEKEFGFLLNDAQKKAVATALYSNVSVITGGPGTGKTTLLKFILSIFQKNFSGNIKLCSPTGKAARRMAESTGFQGASTIHNLLGLEKDFEWSINSRNDIIEIEADLLVIDEASMLDMELMYLLISSVPKTCKVVFIGDVDQLPSVGPGNVLKEIIDSGVIPTAILDKIYRQSEQSNIIKNSYYFNKQEPDKLVIDKGRSVKDTFILKKPREDLDEQIAEIFCNSVKKSSLEDVQILTPYKSEKYKASAYYLNKIIQEKINPSISGDTELKYGKKIYRLNDRVIQQKNTADVKNGDVGKIISVNFNVGELPSITIDFGDDNIVTYTKDEIEENKLELAYALTVHKSQGSEYKTVIFPCVASHKFMLSKKLVYTAWTRAKEHLIVVGDKETISYAAHNTREDIRNTVLANRIRKRRG